MAKTFFQPVGKWFPRGGRTMVLAPKGSSYLFALPCDDTTLKSISQMNADNVSAGSKGASLIMTVSTSEPNVVTDIPEGFVFYLADSPDGASLSSGNGCFITWSE